MEFLQVPVFDDDFYKLLVRFAFDLVFLALVVKCCYHIHQKNRGYTFTFVLMNVTIFFICFTLKKIDLGLGIALGLFAIFAIIRFRTDAIRVKDMTYLFIVIGIAVINALSNKKTSYAELLFTNAAIVAIAFLLETSLKSVKLSKQDIVYDRMDLLDPANETALFADIKERIGITATRVKFNKIDLQKQAVNMVVYYEPKHPA